MNDGYNKVFIINNVSLVKLENPVFLFLKEGHNSYFKNFNILF